MSSDAEPDGKVEQEPLNLEDLNGAELTWERKDGTVERVEFGDGDGE